MRFTHRTLFTLSAAALALSAFALPAMAQDENVAVALPPPPPVSLTKPPMRIEKLKTDWKMEKARYGMPAVAVGKSLYIIGGSSTDGFLGDIVKFTPSTGAMETLTEGLIKRRYHTAEAWGRYIYIMGGVAERDLDDNMTSVVERFDTETGEVKQMAPMPVGNWNPCSVVAGGRIFVIGGREKTGFSGRVQVYEIAKNAWSEATPMPTPRFADAVVKQDRIWVVGGWAGDLGVPPFEVFRMSDNSWEKRSDLPVATSAHHMAIAAGKLFSFGDFDHPERVLVYDFARSVWYASTETGFKPCRNNAVVALDDTVYSIGGNTGPNSGGIDDIQAFRISQ